MMLWENKDFLWYMANLCADFLAGTISEEEFDSFSEYFAPEDFEPWALR